MGDLRADLRSDVHAPWLPSGLHTAALQTWGFPDKRSYTDVPVYLDGSRNRTDKVHEGYKDRYSYFQPSSDRCYS